MKIDGIKLKEYKCEKCGVTFYSKGTLQIILCYNCKKIHNAKKEKIAKFKKRSNERKSNKEKPPKAVEPNRPSRSLNECVKILENYNARNGTHYTYGNFPYKELFLK